MKNNDSTSFIANAEKKRNRAKWWFLVHSWAALPIWAFVFFICVSGTIATVSQEITWLVNPAVRANAPDNATTMLSFDEIRAAVKQAQPTAIIKSIERPVKSQFALTVQISYPDASSASVFVNPYTGVIQGTSSGLDFRSFMRALHGWLLMPFTVGYSIGWYIVAFFGVPMMISLVTGLVVYKRFWKSYFTPRLRINRGSRVFWGDFHRLAGIWSVPFIAIISVTAMWFFIQAALYDNNITFSTLGPPKFIDRQEVPNVPLNAPKPVIGLDASTKVATDAFDDLEPEMIYLPLSAYSHYRLRGRSQNYPLLYEYFDINPYSGKLETSRRVSDLSMLEIVTGSMRPLHTGDFVGLSLKLVYFFFGILLSMMIFSGMMIWTKRTYKSTQTLLSRSTKAPSKTTKPEPSV
ncbi:MAG: PepSY-associated TM helix domain-containing protein [Marinomonas sp.]|jgi:uncharacterized iron-regulated membrane protein|uniref:PepSY-associated TM helix domain-containing protein n=2 Tax=Marinomonas TaxID=28253 RepID=UPI003A909885